MFYYLMALGAGLGIAVQAGINNQMKNILGEPVQASFVNFVVGTVALAAFLAVSGKLALTPDANLAEFRWWKLAGGLIGAFYIYTIIVLVPVIGPANVFSLIVAGQVITSLVLDHFGLLGFDMHPLNAWRVVGAIIMIGGVYIIQKN